MVLRRGRLMERDACQEVERGCALLLVAPRGHPPRRHRGGLRSPGAGAAVSYIPLASSATEVRAPPPALLIPRSERLHNGHAPDTVTVVNHTAGSSKTAQLVGAYHLTRACRSAREEAAHRRQHRTAGRCRWDACDMERPGGAGGAPRSDFPAASARCPCAALRAPRLRAPAPPCAPSALCAAAAPTTCARREPGTRLHDIAPCGHCGAGARAAIRWRAAETAQSSRASRPSP